MARLKALLFDKDGTLFDFDATWSAVTRAVIAEMAPGPAAARAMALAGGLDPATGRFRAGSPLVAGHIGAIAEAWQAHLPGSTAAAVEARIRTLSAAMTGPETLVPAVEDLPALLGRLAAAGFALGVATHDGEAAARRQLAAVGAPDAFAFVAGYDSGHGWKPGPGMLRAFSRETGVPPGGIAMIGDSVHDLMMVRAAGAAMAVGVLTGPATEADLAPHADHVIPSIGALPALLDRSQ